MTQKNEHISAQEADILSELADHGYCGQQKLSDKLDLSVGLINKLLKKMKEQGLLTASYNLTDEAEQLIKHSKPENAVILAAGVGMRMVPINVLAPKALLEIDHQCLIERQIQQLHEAGINNITIVTGFMKDAFEYLIDEYGVKLIYNSRYYEKNNLHSLAAAADLISSTYIIPCDLWCAENPFRKTELYSWYMISEQSSRDSFVRINRKRELIRTVSGGNQMIGISYLCGESAVYVKKRLAELVSSREYDQSFWEEALFLKDRMIVNSRMIHEGEITEINTYEQLRDLDSNSSALQSDAINTICRALNVSSSEINNISILKKGMTNRSFLFEVHGKKYIMRIPGAGTEQMINRRQEAEVYQAIRGKGLCDDPVYINPENGYKITAFLENVRVCNAEDEQDLVRCMNKLRSFHEMKLRVQHTFDIFEHIERYESFWIDRKSIYRDHDRTKANVFSLKEYIDQMPKDCCLTHIDAVCDNFLFYGKNGTEELQLTDWEYAGMQDPHVDIAMFCIYSMYAKEQVDHLIDLYFEGDCPSETRIKIYCYISACGLLWSDWCEFKRQLGVEFGEYSLRQYRYAKEYYKYAAEAMRKSDNEQRY